MRGREGHLRAAPAGILAGAALCLFLSALCPGPARGRLVDQVTEKYSAVVRAVARDLQRRYDNLTELMDEKACGCSHHMCGNIVPQRARCVDVKQEDYTSRIALLVEEFLGCRAPGPCGHRQISMDDSGVMTPSDVIIEDPVLGLSVVEDICMTQGMEDTFKSVNNFTGEYIDRMYFASARSGVLRKWPLTFIDRSPVDGTCRRFDPRKQPWYKTATSEPKNVVIILEATRTMALPFHFAAGSESQSRWDIAKATVRSLLGTLDESSDFFNVFLFNSQEVVLLEGGSLVKASRANLTALNEKLDNTTLVGVADSKVAFDAAFDLFIETFNGKEYAAGCQNIVIHIGDGQDCTVNGGRPCSLAQSAEKGRRLNDSIVKNLDAVEARQKELELLSSRAAIFTLTVEGGEDSLARQLACRNGGAWFMLDGRAEPLNSMEAYFQYLALSMEPPKGDSTPSAIFTPLTIDYVSLNNVSNVLYPVFVNPPCPDGSPSEGKLLLGVVGKDVTLRTLINDGLTEGRVKSMINENLGALRRCDGSYKYSHCELQRLRGTAAECPSNLQYPSGARKCHNFRTKHYFLETEPKQFRVARQQCQALGGRLAELSAEDGGDQQHFLATIVPPDGAWIGLTLVEDEWMWDASMLKVTKRMLEQLWVKTPPKVGGCRAGFIDPRGTLRNVGSRICQERMPFVCEFNATETEAPEVCQGQVAVVSSDDLVSGTALGCAGCSGHGKNDWAKPSTTADRNVICDLGKERDYSEIMCCSDQEFREICLAKGFAVKKAKNNIGRKPLACTIAAGVALLVLAMVILWMEVRAPGTTKAIYRKYIQRSGHDGSVHKGATVAPIGKDQLQETEEGARLQRRPRKLDRERVIAVDGGWQVCGAHGDVKEGVWLDEDNRAHRVAIKSPKCAEMEKRQQTIAKELHILASIPPHANIVSVIGWCLEDVPLIVEEFMATNLKKVLQDTEQGLTYDQILNICLDVAKGLDHLHEHHITHYDIKPSNILLDMDWNAKLADFSCSEQKLATSISACIRGTLGYIAPEILEEGLRPRRGGVGGPKPHLPAEKIDVYSFGKVMLECVTGGLSQENARAAVVCHEPLVRLISDCISSSPRDRPGCKQIIERLQDMLSEGRGEGPDWRGQRPMQEILSASRA